MNDWHAEFGQHEVAVGEGERVRHHVRGRCELVPNRRTLPTDSNWLKLRKQRNAAVVFTRDHAVIKRWAAARHAEPATGEVTNSGPATVHVNDGGAGIRFIFPGTGEFRPITWEEWLENFDSHQCAFVYEHESEEPLSSRYRIVKTEDWKAFLQ